MRNGRRLTTLMVVLALLCPPPLMAVPLSNKVKPDSAQYLILAERLKESVNQAELDLDELLLSQDFETAALLDFLNQKIRFEQYPGLLRGPHGTMFAHAGNALDQSVLLAHLLNDAGLKARIVRGKLSQADAQRLLDGMASVQPKPSAFLANALALVEKTDHREAAVWLNPAVTDRPGAKLVQDTAALIERTLDQRQQANADNTEGLLTEAADYFWVEYQEGTDSYQAAHPAFGGTYQPSVEAQQYFTGSVPKEFQHQLRVRVFLERLEGDALIVEQLTPDWQRPVANMIGQSFSVVNNPLDLGIQPDDPDYYSKLAQGIDKNERFVTLINGQVLPGTKGFDVDGVPYSMEALEGDSFGMAQLVRTASKKLDSATAALSNLGNDKGRERLRYLTAQWIEYSLIAPNGVEQNFRRDLIDRIGPQQRQLADFKDFQIERARSVDLLAGEIYTVAVGTFSDALLVDEYAATMTMVGKLAQSKNKTLNALIHATKDTRGPEALRLFSTLRRFDAHPTAAQTYRSAPTVLAIHWSSNGQDQTAVSTDIMTNERRAHAWRDLATGRQRILEQGVWETYAERYALEDWQRQQLPTQFGQSITTPFASLENDQGQPAGILVVNDLSEHEVSELNIDADVLARMQQDATRHIVLVGTSPDNGSGIGAWWRVDSKSGSVIGVLADGRGAAAATYVVLLGIVLGAVAAVGAYGRCIKRLATEAKMCIGSIGNYILGDFVDPYTDQNMGGCMAEEINPFAASTPPKCRCGGLSEPACPQP